MNLRKITSLVAFFSFAGTVLTSIILYITPHGRIAYWADWHMWGLTKDDWGGVHINLGFVFLLAGFLHVYYNWKPLINYFKTKAKQAQSGMMSRESILAIVITLLTVAGTLGSVPPFSTILDAGESIKESYIPIYGEPPFGHAELASVKALSMKTDIKAEEALKRLAEKGITATYTDKIKEIATANNMSPKQVFDIMQGPKQEGASGFPPTNPSGLGKKSISALSKMYNLDQNALLAGLAAKGYQATPESTLKDLADQQNSSPLDVYMLLKQIHENNQ